MKKLLTTLTVIVLLIGGCGLLENKNTREYMEKHFSYLEKVYPTKNVGELFEKFPNGVKINHSISKENSQDQSLDVSYFELTVDSKQHRIYGTERKINILNGKTSEIYTEKVEYTNGEITYPENSNLSNKELVFLFQQVDYSALKNFELVRVRYDYQQPLYVMQYWVPTSIADKLIFENTRLYIYFNDHGRKNATVEISTTDSSYTVAEQFMEGDNNEK